MKKYIEDKYSKLLFLDITSHGNKAWFCNSYFSALFEIDLNSLEFTLLSWLPEEKEMTFQSYSAIAYYEEKLIIAPRNEHRILIYDLEKNKLDKEIPIDVSIMGDESNVFNLFSRIAIIGNFAYILPGRYPAIIKLNLVDYSISLIDDWYKSNKDAVVDEGRTIFSTAGTMHDDILLPFWQVGRMLIFHAKEENWDVVQTPQYEKFIFDIATRDNEAYVSSCIKNTICKIEQNKAVEWLDLDQYPKSGEGILRICLADNEMIVFPSRGKSILSINLETKEVIESIACKDEVQENQKSAAYVDNQFLCARRVEDKILACSVYEGLLYVYSLTERKWAKKELVVPQKYEEDLEKRANSLYMNDFMYETNDGILEGWLDWVTEK